MRRLQQGQKLVVASHNKGKVWEINQLIAPYGFEAVSAGDLGLPEPDETETTFVGNARLKAVAAAKGSGLPALADDSGLEVAILSGAPGIYSARWAGPGKDFAFAMQRVADEIEALGGWSGAPPIANFISVLCLAWPDGETAVFEGKVFGHLVRVPRGGNGFGYDPIFVPDGDVRTFGEMEPADKYAISHRTRAFAAFKAAMLEGLATQDAKPDSNSSHDFAALSAAAASLSTRLETAAFIARLRQEVLAGDQDLKQLSLDEFLANLERQLAADRADPSPAWRQIANALLAATRKS